MQWDFLLFWCENNIMLYVFKVGPKAEWKAAGDFMIFNEKILKRQTYKNMEIQSRTKINLNKSQLGDTMRSQENYKETLENKQRKDGRRREDPAGSEWEWEA